MPRYYKNRIISRTYSRNFKIKYTIRNLHLRTFNFKIRQVILGIIPFFLKLVKPDFWVSMHVHNRKELRQAFNYVTEIKNWRIRLFVQKIVLN